MSRELVTNTNIAAMDAQRYMGKASTQLTKSQRELGSGSRVSDPSADPSSAAVGLVLQSDIGVLTQASKNAIQASAMLQMYIGVLNETSGLLTRMSTLATQANADTIDDSKREILNTELQRLLYQVDLNAKVKWGDNQFINSDSTQYVQMNLGHATADTLAIDFYTATTTGLAINGISITSLDNADTAQTALTAATGTVSTWISNLGALKNQLDYMAKTNEITIQGLAGAKSTFVDADVAESLMAVQENQALFDMSTAAFNRSAQRAGQLARIVASALGN